MRAKPAHFLAIIITYFIWRRGLLAARTIDDPSVWEERRRASRFNQKKKKLIPSSALFIYGGNTSWQLARLLTHLCQTSHALHDLLLIATVYASMNHSSTKQIVVDVVQNSVLIIVRKSLNVAYKSHFLFHITNAVMAIQLRSCSSSHRFAAVLSFVIIPDLCQTRFYSSIARANSLLCPPSYTALWREWNLLLPWFQLVQAASNNVNYWHKVKEEQEITMIRY